MKIKSIRNININTKLIILGLVSIGGLVLTGAESMVTARRLNQASTDISESWLPAVIIAEELNTAISDYRLLEHYYVIAEDKKAIDASETELIAQRREIEAGFEKYKASVASDEDEAMMEEAKLLWNRYLECSDRLLSISRNNRPEEAMDLIRDESWQMFNKASDLFLEIVDFNKRGAEEASIRGDKLYTSLIHTKTIIVGLIGLLIAIIIIYIIRAIEKPVADIVEGTRRVSNGDLSVYLDYRSEDEIGVLTDSVNALIGRLNDIIKDEKHLLHEIGNENYHAKSECQQAYRGDFAPILYAITSLQSRLEQSQLNRKKRGEKPEKRAVIERIELRSGRDK